MFIDGSSTLTSTTFTFGETTGCTLRDNGVGVVQVVQEESTALEVINNNIGSIDYTTGKVTINQINVAAYAGDGITVSAVPVVDLIISFAQLHEPPGKGGIIG